MRKGIDLSKWNGDIDFTAVKAAGIEFVILRSGWSLYTDPKFYEYIEQCDEVRIPVKAVYHFSYALNIEEAKEEARFVVRSLLKTKLTDIIIFFDFEYDTIDYAKGEGVTLGPIECNAFAEAFCNEIEAQGYKVGIYLNLDFYTYWYDHTLLSRFVSWLASYDDEAPLPCLFQQYSCTGRIDGITGDVDLDNYYGKDTVEETEDDMNFANMTDEQVDALLVRISQRLAALPVTDFALESSKLAVQSGIFSDGDKDGLIDNPVGFLRRQELAVVLNRAGVLAQAIAQAANKK